MGTYKIFQPRYLDLIGLGTGITLHFNRHPLDFEFGPFGQRALAQMIKIALNPFIFQIAEFADLQIDADHPLNIISLGVFQDNLQNLIRNGEFVHRLFSFSKKNSNLTPSRLITCFVQYHFLITNGIILMM
jgi:hypothetical protein